ncbi:MAG: PKD domain-containing protein, partial [Bacteroidota bacterium]
MLPVRNPILSRPDFLSPRALFSLVVSFLATTPVWAQTCPSVSFAAADTVCLSEVVSITNTSTADSYEWAVGESPLNQAPSRSLVNSIPAQPFGADYVYDGENWYGFITSRSGNSLSRVFFGPDLNNPSPTITSLGNPNGNLNLPDKIKIFEEDGQWYGLVTNDQTSNNLILLTFSGSLGGSVSSTSLGNYGVLNRPRGLDVVYEGDSLIVGLTNRGNDQLILLRFGSSILNSIEAGDIVTSSVSGSNVLFDLDLFRDCDGWYALTVSNGNNAIHKLNFGDTLFRAPLSSENLRDSLISFASPLGITHGFDGREDRIYLTASDELVEVRFTEGINGPVTSQSFSGSLTSNSLIEPVLVADSLFLVTDFSTNQIAQYTFNAPLGNSFDDRTLTTPTLSFADTSGSFVLYLSGFDSFGRTTTTTDTVFVRNSSSPTLSWEADTLLCVDAARSFLAVSDTILASYQWSVNGVPVGTNPTLDITFDSASTYGLTLVGTTGPGCSATYTDSTTVYDAPTASFTTSGLLCTNGEISFLNTTTPSYPDSVVTFLWEFGDGDTSTAFSPNHTYATVNTYYPTLTVTVAGCTDTLRDTLLLQEG